MDPVNVATHLQGPFEHKPIKNFEERNGSGVGVSMDCPFFQQPLLSQEWVSISCTENAGVNFDSGF